MSENTIKIQHFDADQFRAFIIEDESFFRVVVAASGSRMFP